MVVVISNVMLLELNKTEKMTYWPVVHSYLFMFRLPVKVEFLAHPDVNRAALL